MSQYPNMDGQRIFLWECNGPELGTVEGEPDDLGNYTIKFDEEFEGSNYSTGCITPECHDQAVKIEKLMADEGLSLRDAAMAVMGIQQRLPGMEWR